MVEHLSSGDSRVALTQPATAQKLGVEKQTINFGGPKVPESLIYVMVTSLCLGVFMLGYQIGCLVGEFLNSKKRNKKESDAG